MKSIEYIDRVRMRNANLNLIGFTIHGFIDSPEIDEEALEDNAETDLEILKILRGGGEEIASTN